MSTTAKIKGDKPCELNLCKHMIFTVMMADTEMTIFLPSLCFLQSCDDKAKRIFTLLKSKKNILNNNSVPSMFITLSKLFFQSACFKTNLSSLKEKKLRT